MKHTGARQDDPTAHGYNHVAHHPVYFLSRLSESPKENAQGVSGDDCAAHGQPIVAQAPPRLGAPRVDAEGHHPQGLAEPRRLPAGVAHPDQQRRRPRDVHATRLRWPWGGVVISILPPPFVLYGESLMQYTGGARK